MLILARKPGERLVIPSIDLEVVVLRSSSESVRLGFEAPDDVAIIRKEVVENHRAESLLRDLAKERSEKCRLRNLLGQASLGYALIKKQISQGESVEQISRTVELLDGKLCDRKRESRPVLLCDDNRNEREMLSAILRLSGYEVSAAEDIDEADGKAKQKAALIDMGPDGTENRELVRRLKGGMKIFAFSGAEPEGKDDLERWYRKPVDVQTLLDDLDAACR